MQRLLNSQGNWQLDPRQQETGNRHRRRRRRTSPPFHSQLHRQTVQAAEKTKTQPAYAAAHAARLGWRTDAPWGMDERRAAGQGGRMGRRVPESWVCAAECAVRITH